MSQQIICDKCRVVLDEDKLFAILTIASVPTTDKASMDLCEDCFNEIVRASKKWTYEESRFFPNNFGKRVEPKILQELVPEPAPVAEDRCEQPVFSVPLNVPPPNEDRLVGISPLSSADVKQQESDVF